MYRTLSEISSWKNKFVRLCNDIDLFASYVTTLKICTVNQQLFSEVFDANLRADEILYWIRTNLNTYKEMTPNGRGKLEQAPFRVLYAHPSDTGITVYFQTDLLHDVIPDEAVAIEITLSLRLNHL
jgi:hypothetical protein